MHANSSDSFAVAVTLSAPELKVLENAEAAGAATARTAIARQVERSIDATLGAWLQPRSVRYVSSSRS
jgi:hypothetical protein